MRMRMRMKMKMKMKMKMRIKETLILKEILLRMTLYNLIEETL
jgi:hypothetical protein